MLNHPTLDQLKTMKLSGMAQAFEEQLQRADLNDLSFDDRHALRSTIVTSQLPVKQWHEIIGDPTLADAILDRLVHNAYTINLKGESMRKKYSNLTHVDHAAQ